MSDPKTKKIGTVYLVGAGPGDPELVTLKAKKLIESADVLLYDFLAPQEVLDWASPNAEVIYVGKHGGDHTLPQETINSLLVEKAKAGKRVVRLKGGDPFIFGRGGEEAEVLVNAGVPFEMIPGISSAIAAPLYAGIPLTHRSNTSSIVLITGHETPNKDCSAVPWNKIASGGHTIVILMGMKHLRANIQCLLDGGIDPDTPVAIIRWGTRPDQLTITATVATIADEADRTGIKAPAIIVIGDVVRHRERLKWFEVKPLFGKRILVTRTREQANELSILLKEAGAFVYEIPTIEIVPTPDSAEVNAALDKLPDCDWVVLTSVNGVKLLVEALRARGGDVRDLAGKRIAAIGPATAKAIEDLALKVDLVPKEYKAEGLAEALGKKGIRGKRFLLARASAARDALPKKIKEMGGETVIAPVYDTRAPAGSAQKIKELLNKGKVEIAVFTSSSTVRNFMDMAHGADTSKIRIASIGPVTSQTARELGLEVHIQPAEYTIPALVNSIIEFYGES